MYPEPAPRLTPANEQWLDNYLARVKHLIINEARAISDQGGTDIGELDLAEAVRKYAPGRKFPAEPSFWDRLKGSLSGITAVSAVLALIFGLLGLFVLKEQKQEYFDIVKLFAGAVVGSTGVGLAASSKRG